MILKKGMRSGEVRVLQGILYDLSLLGDPPDGIFGQDTETAVIRFQESAGLRPDGLVGQNTLNALYASSGDRAKGIEPALPEPVIVTMDWIIRDKTGIEAGYVNNSDDLGGETNHGITKAKALEHAGVLRSKFNWNSKMRDLTQQMAFYIYQKDFWDAMCLDEVHSLDPYIADKMFDIGINTGTGRPSEWLQILICVLNKKEKLYPDIGVDGGIGKETIGGLKDCFRAHGSKRAGWTVMKGLLCKQGNHYIDISYQRENNETFTMGWMNRLDHNLKLYSDHYKVL